ncbi:threonine ammonia-lyase, partial [Desulfococcus sp.]|uniref:threonine ammonia-lyase n=1 Tax=Desulfococcus sp. TaxID=2025834 RepID=UPI003592F307
VAASAGNHAQGVALAARKAGIAATVVMPEWASISKQEATRSYGGTVVLSGQSLGESLMKAEEIAREGKTFIHPFDDPDIITGQGTIGVEILDDLSDVDAIVVPVGGGGLIAGIASMVKPVKPSVRIIGVQAAACPSAAASRKAGRIVEVPARLSIADGITVKQIGQRNFEVIQRWVDDIVLVEEEEIAAAVLMLLERKKILAEGAGAVPLAALMNCAVNIPPGRKGVLVISGGNVDSPLLGRIIQKGLLENGRIMRVRIHLADIPGSLSGLLQEIARLKANVLHIYHDRDVKDLPIHMTYVALELEVRGPGHIEEIMSALSRSGYEIQFECGTSPPPGN